MSLFVQASAPPRTEQLDLHNIANCHPLTLRSGAPAKRSAATEPAHSFRAGSKGVSSGAARPSSTSGASRLAVAGARVTPSIPCPVAR